jgi:hypothetical protein
MKDDPDITRIRAYFAVCPRDFDDENEVTEQPLSNLSDLPDSAEGLLLACHGQGTAGRKLISTASERRIPFVCRRRKRPLSQDGEAGR